MILDIREIYKSCNCNFIYKITNQSHQVMSSENSLSFVSVENCIFSNNLVLIDSSLCSILAEVIRIKHLNPSFQFSKLLEHLSSLNPLCIDTQAVNLMYGRKLKEFLSAIALGMTQDKVWTGAQNPNEHRWMFKNGDFILPHHILKKYDFENYLLNNTKLETPSSTRHGFGIVYEENGAQFIKLNLQIRFIG
jgi:hypothetical protein